MKLGFIGLGIMGAPMTGHTLFVTVRGKAPALARHAEVVMAD